MSKVFHGVVRGKTNQVSEDLGFADGQEVEVFVRPILAGRQRHSGDGLRRTEGAWVDDPHWDAIMEEIHRERKSDTR